MTTLTELDLDLAEEDLRQDPILLPIKGLGTFEFPGVINAMAKVRVLAMQAEGRNAAEELTPAEALAMFRDLIPDETIRAMSNAGFDVTAEQNLPRVEVIVSTLMAEYHRRDQEERRPGGAVAVETPPPFSGTGPFSSPTSAVSTASPFPVS